MWLVSTWPCEEQKAVMCYHGSVRTILVIDWGAARANPRAAAVKGLPFSVCLWVIRLLFAWLAWVLLLSGLLRGLPMSHGDLLLVQSQGMWGQHCLATPNLLTDLHRGFWHLNKGWEEKKYVTSTLLCCVGHMVSHIQYLTSMTANKHLFLWKLKSPLIPKI